MIGTLLKTIVYTFLFNFVIKKMSGLFNKTKNSQVKNKENKDVIEPEIVKE